MAQTVEPMLDVFERTGEATEAVFQMLARAGRVDDLRRLLSSTQHRPGEAPWSLVTDWCMEVEAAAAVGDELAPYAVREPGPAHFEELVSDPDRAFVIEAVHEGHLLHHGEPRAFQAACSVGTLWCQWSSDDSSSAAHR